MGQSRHSRERHQSGRDLHRPRKELARDGITTGKPEEELLKTNEARIPLGRYAHPLGIANVAFFLASDCASYVTGALITMDGALTLSCARR
jgi:NAD(P)-dependent dehydrogenase (short-subunit alcohol dehydrogenase family)